MHRWILISTATIALAAATVLGTTGPDGKELAQKGYSAFKDVLSGDEAKLPEAIRLLEAAREADETYVPNLYNLARAYFFDAITFNKGESLEKAEKAFGRMIELDPTRTDAMAFHGAILAQKSNGQDIPMFMRGAQELKTAFQKAPEDITVRIVMAFVKGSVPPEAQQFLGGDEPVSNARFVGKVFESFSSDFAPHANVVMNAFIGEALLTSGDKANARATFENALKVPQPLDAGQIAGRKLLDDVIRTRMNGGEQPIFANPVFSGCHSCHLSAPDKLLKRS
jgi:tetratricopeptide (TPR) repeat protein